MFLLENHPITQISRESTRKVTFRDSYNTRSKISSAQIKFLYLHFRVKDSYLTFSYGVVHKPCEQIFGHFDPSPPLWTILLNKAYAVIRTFDKPPSPCHVHMVYECPLLLHDHAHE